MRTIVKAKHWQIFGILFGITILQKTIDIEVMTGDVNEIFSDISFIIFYMTTIGWILFTGVAVNKNQETDKKLNFKIPTITGLLLLISVITFRFSMTIDETFEFMNDRTSITVGFILYGLASLIIVCSYTAKTLKLNETKDEVDINDYFNYILGFLFWPIGIWFIQPRVNRLFQTADKGQQ